jgi:hypothetical protein
MEQIEHSLIGQEAGVAPALLNMQEALLSKDWTNYSDKSMFGNEGEAEREGYQGNRFLCSFLCACHPWASAPLLSPAGLGGQRETYPRESWLI